MHVGMGVIFQGEGEGRTDRNVYRNELRIGDLAEPLGFESLWGVEHHFTEYTMCPDVLQYLTYFAGRTERIQLGSMVVVLPWHDPLRVAEQVSVQPELDTGRGGDPRTEWYGDRVGDREEHRLLYRGRGACEQVLKDRPVIVHRPDERAVGVDVQWCRGADGRAQAPQDGAGGHPPAVRVSGREVVAPGIEQRIDEDDLAHRRARDGRQVGFSGQ